LTACFPSDIFLSAEKKERKMKKNFAGRVPTVAALSFLFIAAGIFIASACEGISGKTVNIMSFNIRYDNPEDGDNSWANRKETEKDLPYKMLTSGTGQIPGLSDVYTLTKSGPYGSTQTFNGFQDKILPDYRIDFIFAGEIDEVLRCGTVSERWDGRFVSDHNAVLAEIEMNER
jgi:hypothetical protein